MTPTNRRVPGPPEPKATEAPAAERIREVDWAATQLGPRETWDQSLSGSVEMMLGSSAATALAWGPDLTILFNDAWAMSVGGRASLGRTVSTRQDAPWPHLAGFLDEARRGGKPVSVPADEAGQDFRILPIFGEAGGTAGLWIRARGGREVWLPVALDVGRIAMWDWEPATGRMEWSDETCRILGRQVQNPKPSFDDWCALLHPEDRERVVATLEGAAQASEDLEVSFRLLRPDGSIRWCVAQASGNPSRTIGVLRDDTEFAAAQRKQRAMHAELRHRVRNMLAVIRSFVRRSADSANDIEDLASHLEGRIGALARLQTILMQDPEGGIDLETLLREELLQAAAGDDQAHLSGPKVGLPARTAQAICMTFHELTTNALKFGALSEPHGELDVTWRHDAGELAISWQERGVPRPQAPAHSGVGLEQLGRVLPYETGARVSYDFSGDGFRCTIALELSPSRAAGQQE